MAETVPPNEALFSLFEDLLEDRSASPSSDQLQVNDQRDDDEPLVHKLDANALTLNELVQELEKRGLQARGFFADDAKVLQEKFDEEHDLYVETKRREKREAREAEAKRAAVQRRRLLMETEIREEREEIERNHRMKSWLVLSEKGLAPSNSRIDVNDITARSLAKALLSDSTIVCLDVSNLGLSDLAGAYLCRALRSNKCLVKIELGSNKLGPKTCKSLGDALATNDVVQYVSLESNPLTGDKNDISGVLAIADMLPKNKALRYLSLWRCGTGTDAGKAITDAVAVNDTLTCIEVGYNGWESAHIRQIAEKLVINRAQLDVERKAAETKRLEEERRLQAEREAQAERERQEAEEAWIEEQKVKRANDRREDMERLAKERAEEEERLRQEEERRLLEEKRAAEAAKKKKKKGKGKKKKK